MTEPASDRIDRLTAALDALEGQAGRVTDLAADIRRFAGLVARLGLRIMETGGRGQALALRRFEAVTIPETITLLDHVAGLRAGGLAPTGLGDVRELLETRARALEAEIISAEERQLSQIEPGLDLGLRGARIDPDRAIAAFRGRTGTGSPVAPVDEAQAGGADLFLDYTAADLPDEDREDAAARIAANPALKRYTHDELLAIDRLLEIVRRADGYGYGVAQRRRPMFSKARRAFLWGAPRIGMIMVTHIPTWRRTPAIGDILLDVRRYEQHMRDMAAIPEDDDYFNEGDPLVQAVRRDSRRILSRSLGVVNEVAGGPSAFRFADGFFRIFPGPDQNYAQPFMAAAREIRNAMAVAGVGGKGERDRAMAREAQEEAERAERSDAPGFIDTLRGIFAG